MLCFDVQVGVQTEPKKLNLSKGVSEREGDVCESGRTTKGADPNVFIAQNVQPLLTSSKPSAKFGSKFCFA